jgi:hypothetical protein
MTQVVWRTVRVRRGWLDRLKGFDRLYETKITDGKRTTFGRGPTRETSDQAAQRNWDAKFGQEAEGVGGMNSVSLGRLASNPELAGQ